MISKTPFGIPLLPASVFCSILVLTNVLCQWQVSLWRFTATIGLFIYPLSFLVSNYVNEMYGKKVSKQLVRIGFFVSLLPSLFLSTVQITAGSMLAYLSAQMYDVFAYNWWKIHTKGKHLWLRNNASGFVSLLIDTVVFSTVAFYGVLDWDMIVRIMYTEYPIKCIYTIFNTAPLYVLVGIAHKKFERTGNILNEP